MKVLIPYKDLAKCSEYLDDKLLSDQIELIAFVINGVMDLNFPICKIHPNNYWIEDEEYKWAKKNLYTLLSMFGLYLIEYKVRFNKNHEFFKYCIDFGKDHDKLTKPKELKSLESFNDYKKEIKEYWFQVKKKPKWTNRNIPDDYLIIDLKRRTK